MGTLFNDACDYINLGKDGTTMLRDLYTEKHRHYHNLNHIEELLSLAQGEGQYDTKIVKAILFHDAVYVAGSRYNEQLSASHFFNVDSDNLTASEQQPHDPVTGKLWFSPDLEVYNAILATINHLSDDHEHAPKWVHNFLDYDLAGFANAKKFDANTIKLFRENLPVFTFEECMEGRKEFLVSHLAHKRLYWNHPQWEQPARDNIYRELSAMEDVEDYKEWVDCEISLAIGEEINAEKQKEAVADQHCRTFILY